MWKQPKSWHHLQHAPMRQLAVFLAGAFLLFTMIGFHDDLIQGGTEPYAVVLADAIVSGLYAVLWVVVVARMRNYVTLCLALLTIVLPSPLRFVDRWLMTGLRLTPVDPKNGLYFSATAIMVVVVAAYICFARYIAITGEEAFRIKTELQLAHSIQKTLVPAISLTTPSFEIYGVSEPSEKVGGDLVDVVRLPGGDAVAYLADIAGHGLQAGILMGMLKTSTRTALGESDPGDSGPGDRGGAVLSRLMLRLNQVLPQVKEAHMYATFAALRLNADGLAWYGMAASTPLLHWSAAETKVIRIEEEQFPLGLLPVPDFPSAPLPLAPGDVVLIATDGVLEVTGEAKSLRGVEFGVDALERLLVRQIEDPLPVLAAAILAGVRSYGRQLDDQTLLLVRRRLVGSADPASSHSPIGLVPRKAPRNSISARPTGPQA
jgi:serine phosphatase RsbU (regulator of sigma subunit)